MTLDHVMKGENRYVQARRAGPAHSYSRSRRHTADISSVLVKPSRKSVMGWEVVGGLGGGAEGGGAEGVFYENLGALVCSIEDLVWLYPHYDKRKAFGEQGGRAYSSGSRSSGIGAQLHSQKHR
jgi:hypothetical protein